MLKYFNCRWLDISGAPIIVTGIVSLLTPDNAPGWNKFVDTSTNVETNCNWDVVIEELNSISKEPVVFTNVII